MTNEYEIVFADGGEGEVLTPPDIYANRLAEDVKAGFCAFRWEKREPVILITDEKNGLLTELAPQDGEGRFLTHTMTTRSIADGSSVYTSTEMTSSLEDEEAVIARIYRAAMELLP